MHAPHHVPKEWADKYKGKFDDGWDDYREKPSQRQNELGIVPDGHELSRHDPDVPEWDSFGRREEALCPHDGSLRRLPEHTDHHIGRLLDFLKNMGELDNTLIMVISDNGASSEGGPHGSVNENMFFNNVPDSLEENLAAIDELGGPKYFNHYPWGWTFAGNTPFRRWKRETYRGGISDPFIVHWPKGIKAKGEIRTQYAHAIDMVPTVLEALGIEAADQHQRRHAVADRRRQLRAHLRRRQGADEAHHAVLRDVRPPRHLPRRLARGMPWPGTSFTEAGMFFGAPIDGGRADANSMPNAGSSTTSTKDFAENDNIAAENREKLIEMIGIWYVEAGKYDVLPMDARHAALRGRAPEDCGRSEAATTRYPNTQGCPANALPALLNRRSITAEVKFPGRRGGRDAFQGGNDGGHSLMFKTANYLRLQLRRSEPVQRRSVGRSQRGVANCD